MKSRKTKLLIFLFLTHFIFYAVSPICYAEDKISENGSIANKTEESNKKVVFMWDLIVSKLLYHKNSSGSLPTIQLLIKKARAILETNTIIKITKEYSASAEKIFVSPVTQFQILLIQTPCLIYKDFVPLFSGLSPPSV
ncbi:MAG: hypothetical protein ABIB41_00475 [Nitrospirota bacterium]